VTGNKPTRVIPTPRDLHLLRELAEVKILDREQVQLATGIHGINRANDRLGRLHKAGLLRRHFQGTAAGGRKAIYSLAHKGAALVQVDRLWRLQHAEDELLIGDSFTAHQMAVNWIWVSAKYRLPFGVEFLSWRSFQEPISAALPLIPDGYFEIRFGGEEIAHFIEADLGTESSRVWDRKAQLYVKLATSGEFSRIFKRPRFRVLVSAPSDRRLANICATVRKHTNKIFFFLDQKTIHRDGIYAPLWLRPEGLERQSLT